jgi:hypothetical protein
MFAGTAMWISVSAGMVSGAPAPPCSTDDSKIDGVPRPDASVGMFRPGNDGVTLSLVPLVGERNGHEKGQESLGNSGGPRELDPV